MPLPQGPWSWEEGYSCSHRPSVPLWGHCGENIFWLDGDEESSISSFLKQNSYTRAHIGLTSRAVPPAPAASAPQSP